jgi:hypothetical protein
MKRIVDNPGRLQLVLHAFAAGVIAAVVPFGIALAQPVVTFEPQAVAIAGVTPSSELILFGISNEANRYPRRIADKTSRFRTERDGTYLLTVANRIPTASIWVAVDLTTGDYTVASPAGHKLNRQQLPPAALKGRSNGRGARFESGSDEQELLFIRPAVGAWRASGGRSLELASMRPVGNTPPPPDDFAAGDVLVFVDPLSLRVRTIGVR